MLNYRVWIDDLEHFMATVASLPGKVEHEINVAPPLDDAKLKRLNESLRLKIPGPVERFLRHGSGCCVSHYFWEPPEPEAVQLRRILGRSDVFGGVPLCDSEKLSQWQEWCVEGATETWIGDEPEDKALWLRAFPFAFMSHGDFLALDLEQGAGEPPVVYLCHDEESRILSPSFDEFLAQWKQICYLGPDLHLFENFFDQGSGYLSGTSGNAKALRSLLGVHGD